ncbi:DUF1674 domain-containing protein [Roseibacterium sp. SDUM158017]|uniref:DUF1674 domain-containing protein n=1 Tax=Roseicyclus salinarum TaxID=3036773 RepID=UPI002415367B|nr:DUF1674 domain-containing protein [Roseibacterium sp. SDUM158017]MDG4650549.1 DUF1674 domain-containing protein [Roseibacterium sp. SDUM158017]
MHDTPSDTPPGTPEDTAEDLSHLPPAAQRALAEAEERRRKAKELELPPELGGRDGPEPVRYGDWEKKGIAIDF